MQTPTVFVVDDDHAVLDSIARLLATQNFVTECFPSAEAFRQRLKDSPCVGCLVVDLRMPGMTGCQLLERLAQEGLSIPTVVITGHAEIEAVVQTMRLGAIDFLQKPFPPARLLEAVRQALNLAVTQSAANAEQRDVQQRLNALSADEQLVLWGIARGLTNQQIADEMDVSLRTVQLRRSSLFKSLNIQSRPEIVALVQSSGWTPTAPH
ncbi:MAG: response regulator [Planctomycetaceae bacterium]|nr:response regulator [Planctomycetaceae bacterium]